MRLTARPILHLARTLCFLVLAASSAAAQQHSSGSTQATLHAELTRLGTAANALILSLPSFTCEETATSQAIRGGKVVRSVPLSGVIRVIRKPNGDFAETYEFKRKKILFFIPSTIPVFISGGFDSAISYFLPAAQPCYRYSLLPGRIDFAARADAPAGCNQHGMKGFATLDAQGNIKYIERTVPEDVAKPLKVVPFASIDLAPVKLNGRVYQLSHHMVAEMPLRFGGATGRFEATYSGCHLYKATVTLGPSTEVPPESVPNP